MSRRSALRQRLSRRGLRLLDRCAAALLSGGPALLLGALLWAAVSTGVLQGLPFTPVLALAGAAAVLGFLLLENVVAALIGHLAEILLLLGRG